MKDVFKLMLLQEAVAFGGIPFYNQYRIIVLTELFYHQEMLIIASKRSFRCVTLQEQATGNDFYTCGGKVFTHLR
jgi:hypothetical protein